MNNLEEEEEEEEEELQIEEKITYGGGRGKEKIERRKLFTEKNQRNKNKGEENKIYQI